MSLFGSYMGDFEDDPFFGAHIRQMRQMNSMVNSMFANGPFGGMMGGMGGMGALMGGMGPPALTAPHAHPMGQDMMPYGFPSMNMNMNRMFQGMGAMQGDPNCHSYSSSTVMTMSNGPDGRPQVYQESSSTRTAPGGVKEVKKSVCDSRSGVKKLAIGHHIGERGHIMEREQNIRSGNQEERQEFINLEEEEAEDFNKEFERKVSSAQQHSIGYSPSNRSGGHSRRYREPQLALPSSSRSRLRGSSARYRREPAVTGTSSSAPSSSAPTSPAPHPETIQPDRPRKRDHESDPESEAERKPKTLKPSDDLTASDSSDDDSIETITI